MEGFLDLRLRERRRRMSVRVIYIYMGYAIRKEITVAQTLLKTRFDELPVHAACYGSIDEDKLKQALATNLDAVHTKDFVGMTPLHVLCSNLTCNEATFSFFSLSSHSPSPPRSQLPLLVEDPVPLKLERLKVGKLVRQPRDLLPQRDELVLVHDGLLALAVQGVLYKSLYEFIRAKVLREGGRRS